MELNNPTKDTFLCAGYSFHVEPFHSKYEEGTNYYLLRLQTEGEATVWINNSPLTAVPGDLIIAAPNEPYEIQIDPHTCTGSKPGGCGDYYLFSSSAWLNEWWSTLSYRSKLSIPLYDDGIRGIWKQMILEKQRGNQESGEIMSCLLRVLCLNISRCLTEPPVIQGKNPSFMAYQIKSFVELNATSSFSLQQLSQNVGISVSSAMQLFKAHFGKTIKEYALEVRLAIVVERMNSNVLTLEQIAESSGFQNYSYFYRVFSEKYGLSPREYRNQQKIGEAFAAATLR